MQSPKLWIFESPLDCKIQPVHPKGNQFWIFIARTDTEAETPNILATWCKELTHWKRPWCWERLKAGGEGDDRGWDGWMASLTQWVWVSSGNWWWTGRPGVLQSMGLQRVGHDWAIELNLGCAFQESLLFEGWQWEYGSTQMQWGPRIQEPSADSLCQHLLLPGRELLTLPGGRPGLESNPGSTPGSARLQLSFPSV